MLHLKSTILLALGAVAHAKQVRFAGEHALAQTHYGNPNEGACLKDEAPVMVGGIDGTFCAPRCNATDDDHASDCPTDTPGGASGAPSCVIQGPFADRCAIECHADADCGSAGMNCQGLDSYDTGLCTWPPPSSPHWKAIESTSFEKMQLALALAASPTGSGVVYAGGFIPGSGTTGIGAVVEKSVDHGQTWEAVWPAEGAPPGFNIMVGGAAQGDTSAALAGSIAPMLYTSDGSTFDYSKGLPAFSMQQEVDVCCGGKYAIAQGAGLQNNGAAFSDDGAHWTKVNNSQGDPIHFPVRFGAFPSTETFYLTAGLFPTEEDQHDDHSMDDFVERKAAAYAPTSRRSMHDPRLFGGDAKRSDVGPPGDCSADIANCFSAAIYKTTDGGKTFELLFEDINNGTNIYPNDIDCSPDDPDTCVVVLEGETCHIWRTTDGGASFDEVYSGDATCSLVDVSFVTPEEVWVAGGTGLQTSDAAGAFWHSTDAGQTFDVETIPGLYVVDLDIAAPGVGFASAITPYQTCELLRLQNATVPETEDTVLMRR